MWAHTNTVWSTAPNLAHFISFPSSALLLAVRSSLSDHKKRRHHHRKKRHLVGPIPYQKATTTTIHWHQQFPLIWQQTHPLTTLLHFKSTANNTPQHLFLQRPSRPPTASSPVINYSAEKDTDEPVERERELKERKRERENQSFGKANLLLQRVWRSATGVGAKMRPRSIKSTSFCPSINDNAWIHAPPLFQQAILNLRKVHFRIYINFLCFFVMIYGNYNVV
jgi:hypothetical protein